MSKKLRIIIVLGMAILASLVSLGALQANSFTVKNEVRESKCLNFATEGACKYVKESYDVTQFDPINGTSFTIISLALLLFVIAVIAFTYGKNGYSGKTSWLLILGGLFMFIATTTMFVSYGSSRDGKEKFVGGLSYDESICLQSAMRALGEGSEPRCIGDAANKPLDQYWKD